MGGDRCDKLQVLEMSEANEFSWTVKADLPAARWSAASAVVNGKLWLMGGCLAGVLATPSVIIYDPVTDAWVAGPELPREAQKPPRGAGFCRAAVLDGVVHVTSSVGTWRYDGTAWVEVGSGSRDGAACGSGLRG